jgi:hypothetical protein
MYTDASVQMARKAQPAAKGDASHQELLQVSLSRKEQQSHVQQHVVTNCTLPRAPLVKTAHGGRHIGLACRTALSPSGPGTAALQLWRSRVNASTASRLHAAEPAAQGTACCADSPARTLHGSSSAATT